MRYLQSAAIILCMFASSLSAAEEALTVFKAGDKVKAAEINANFELIRAAAADAASYEGLSDAFQGGLTSAEAAQASGSQSQISAQVALMSGVELKQVADMQNSINALADAIIPRSAEDESCVISGNKVTVKNMGAERPNSVAKIGICYIASVRSESAKCSASSEVRLGNTV